MSTSRLRLLALASAVVVGFASWPSPGSAARFRAQRAAPEVSCGACVVIDEDGRVLWARAARTRLPNASTTKMVTALVTVGAADLPSTATVSAAAGSVGGGGLDLQAGDQMTVRDLLYAMLLSSSNEAAATLAEHVAGAQDEFVRLMNRTARQLGARNTHFVNPHGLDQTGHYSSARDLALIGQAVLAVPELAAIVGTSSATIRTPRGPVAEENRNVLLETYEGALGIKTGRTLGAGNVLVAAAQRGDHTLVAVAMRTASEFAAAADASDLLDFGFAAARRLDRPRSTTVLAEGTAVGTLVFDPGGSTSVVTTDTITLDLPPEGPRIRYELVASEVELPVEAGESVGTVNVLAGRQQIATTDAVAADEVPDSSEPLVPNVLGGLIALVNGAVQAVT